MRYEWSNCRRVDINLYVMCDIGTEYCTYELKWTDGSVRCWCAHISLQFSSSDINIHCFYSIEQLFSATIDNIRCDAIAGECCR